MHPELLHAYGSYVNHDVRKAPLRPTSTNIDAGDSPPRSGLTTYPMWVAKDAYNNGLSCRTQRFFHRSTPLGQGVRAYALQNRPYSVPEMGPSG